MNTKELSQLMRLKRFLSLVDTQAKMSLRADASRTYLSYLWWIFEPLVFVGMFYLVFEVLLLRGKPGFFYFLIVGYVPYMWVSKSLAQASGSVTSNKGLIGQTSLSMIIFPYVAFLESFYRQLFVFVVLVVLLLVVGETKVGLVWVWLLPIVVVNFLFIVAISLPFSWLCAAIPDVKIFVSLVTVFLMFTSGVFFNVRDIANLEVQNMIFTYQPLAYILDAYRQVLLYDSPPDVGHLTLLSAVFFFLILISHGVFKVSQHFLAARVLNS